MRNKESPIPPPPPVPDENWHGRLLRAGSSRIRNEKDPHPDFIADARKSGAPRATGRRQHLHNQQPLAQVAPQGVVPPAAALSPESVQLLQSMARDLATVGQRIEQLKASIDQLKASQQQVSRENAKPSESKASEQNVRPKTSTPPPRPTAASTRKPVATLPSPQATAQPQVEKTQLSSAPRAPMPLR